MPNQPRVIRMFKVKYLEGYSHWPNAIHGINMSLTENYFFFQGEFGTFHIPFNRIKSLKVFDSFGMRVYTQNNITRIRSFNILPIFGMSMSKFLITYIDKNNHEIVVVFEMQRIGIGFFSNVGPRMQMIIIMRQNKLFSQFMPEDSMNSPIPSDVFEELERLAELHNSGALPDEDFEIQKAELLKRI